MGEGTQSGKLRFEVVPVNRRFSTVVRRDIEPGTSGGQNVQDAVDQSAGVTPGSTDVRLCWGEVFLNNLPEIIVNFPECHDPQFYPRGLIIIGSPHHENIFVILIVGISILYTLLYIRGL